MRVLFVVYLTALFSNRLQAVTPNEKVMGMNWKLFGKKRSLPNVMVLSKHSPGGTVENHYNLVRIAGLRAEISTLDLPNS
jgi:hypothetical protein